MKRSLAGAILNMFLVFVVCFSSGCSAVISGWNEKNAAPKETLTFRITWKAYSGRGEAIQKIVDTYNASNADGFEIQMVDGDEDFANVNAVLSNAPTADICVLPYRYVQYFGTQDKLLDLTAAFQPEKDYFYQNLWNLGMVDNKTYGIPWLGHSICLLYNKSLLEKAAVDPAAINSVNDLAAACQKVESATQAKGIGLVGANHNDVSWMVNQFIYGFGSGLVDQSGKKVILNNDKSVAALRFYKDTLGKYAQSTWPNDTGIEVMDYFREQQVAFEFQGLWGITDIWKNGSPFEVGVITLDTICLYPEVGPMMLALPAGISQEKKEAAERFIRYLVSREAQEAVMNGEYSPEHDSYYPFRVPVRKDLAESDFFKAHPEFVPFLEGFENPSIDVPVPEWQKIKDDYYEPGLNQVMQNKLSIEDFLKMIEAEGNNILMERP